jgi:hypothetical protein
MWYDRFGTYTMPAKPAYCRNLPEGIHILRNLRTEWVGRKELEDALGISKTVSWRLMRQCGGVVGPGSALICRREDLIHRLERLMVDGGKVQFEVQRRERLADYLEEIRPEVVAVRTKVVPDRKAAGLVATRLESLPEGVVLTRGKLEIHFGSAEEFLSRVGSLIYALNNDYEAIAKFIGGKQDNETPTV